MGVSSFQDLPSISRLNQMQQNNNNVGISNQLRQHQQTSNGSTMSDEGSRVQCKSQNGVRNAELLQGSSSVKNNNMRRSYPRLIMNADSSKREQHILRMLEEDKFLIRPELHKRLEKEKNIMMDRKTLVRSLNKLQQEGYCKCIHVSVPCLTNCVRSKTTEVVLHPSVYDISPELLSQIHDKMRSFEAQVRKQAYTQQKKKSQSVPIVDNLPIIPNSLRVDNQSERAEMMRTNGFVLGKMISTKIFHMFLWDNAFLSSNHSRDLQNPHNSCKLLRLDMAIKSMPLELFLQVVGSAQIFEDLVEKCRSGLLLRDLPIEEYKCLMDTRATGRLSWLIDILRRLKLIRLVSKGHTEDEASSPHTTLTHALELKPYIEEPVESPGFLFPDLRPQVRHDFVLTNRKAVDEYWKTLEYSYAAAESRAALLAFPGSAVHEVFQSRSWASSALVMTADQRAALVKFLAKQDSNKKLSLHECEKITKDLNLTLEQVLRVYHDRQKRPSRSRKGVNTEYQENQPTKDKHFVSPRKRKRYSDNRLSSKLEKQHSLLTTSEDNDYAGDNTDLNEEDKEAQTFVKKCALSRLNSARQRRFSWTEEADRQLVIAYTRHRAKYHRANWVAISDLPAPPDTCKRRMALLNSYIPCRKAVMKLCSVLAEHYGKYLEKFPVNHGHSGKLIKVSEKDDIHSASPMYEKWDNFDDNNIKLALEDVLRYKRMAKLASNQENNEDSDLESSGSKAPGTKSKNTRPLKKGLNISRRMRESVAIANATELFKLIFLSNTTAPEVPSLLAETLRRYSEHDLFAAFSYLRDKKIITGGSCKNSSFALSQHFLHYISSSPFPMDTGKRAARFTRWLHERENNLIEEGVDVPSDMQCGEVLTLCARVSSGEVSIIPCLPDEGVGEVQDKRTSKRKCDDSSELDGPERSKKSKTSFAGEGEIISRREKGFPGIKLSLQRETISKLLAIESFGGKNQSNSLSGSDVNYLKEIIDSERTTSHEVDVSKSPWEAMTRYAECLMSSCSYEVKNPSVHPDLFKTLYSAIQKAGDNGLSMKEIRKVLNIKDEQMLEILIEVLGSFGRALKVNAYDSIHVVDSLYRSKYFLTSVHDHAANARDRKIDDEHMPRKLDNHRDKVAASENEMNMNIDEVHKVTILNLPEDVPTKVLTEDDKIITGHSEMNVDYADTETCRPMLPWMNGDGTINEPVYKRLVRRVLGIVMQNPGMLENGIINQMHGLNPQSCRKLLEIMSMDKHIITRKMHQMTSSQPPSILANLLGHSFRKSKMVSRLHYFANPMSTNLL